MVVLEGMLHGLPIVAADVGGPAEIVEHGRTGLLFPPRDTKSLARALGRLVEHPEEGRRMGRAAAHAVRSTWLWGRLVGLMKDVYAEVVPPTISVLTRTAEVLDAA